MGEAHSHQSTDTGLETVHFPSSMQLPPGEDPLPCSAHHRGCLDIQGSLFGGAIEAHWTFRGASVEQFNCVNERGEWWVGQDGSPLQEVGGSVKHHWAMA